MPNLSYANRVRESSTHAAGTGTLDLGGAVTGWQSFVGAGLDGEVVAYAIYEVDANGVPNGAWENGYGTVTDASPDTLSRTYVEESSNSGSAINLTGNTVYVELVATADKIKTHAVHLLLITDDTIGNTTIATLLWDNASSQDYVLGGLTHSTSTNPGRVTAGASVDGRIVSGVLVVTWDLSNSGDRQIGVYHKNSGGTELNAWVSAIDLATYPFGHYMVLPFETQVSSGDYFEAFVYQDSGANRTLDATTAGGSAATHWAMSAKP